MAASWPYVVRVMHYKQFFNAWVESYRKRLIARLIISIKARIRGEQYEN